MPQNVRIEGTPVEATINATEMVCGKAYIVTSGGATNWPAGTVAFRADNYLIGVGHTTNMRVDTTFKVRDLRPGEKITIQGS